MKTIKIFLTVAIFLSSSTAIANSAVTRIEAAELARSEAIKLGFEWSTTVKLIEQAKASVESGDLKKAEKLANLALTEANNSIKQAKYADNNWQDNVPN